MLVGDGESEFTLRALQGRPRRQVKQEGWAPVCECGEAGAALLFRAAQ